MCCLSFDAEVILGNIFGSDHYKKGTPVDTELIDHYCQYLQDVLSGYKFFFVDQKEIDKTVNKYPMYYKSIGDRIVSFQRPPHTVFNEHYPNQIAEKMQEAADIIWMATSFA